jgi:hypothetical protein
MTARTCRLCGCTDDHACNPPCSWVERDLCSACVPAQIQMNYSLLQDCRVEMRAYALWWRRGSQGSSPDIVLWNATMLRDIALRMKALIRRSV